VVAVAAKELPDVRRQMAGVVKRIAALILTTKSVVLKRLDATCKRSLFALKWSAQMESISTDSRTARWDIQPMCNKMTLKMTTSPRIFTASKFRCWIQAGIGSAMWPISRTGRVMRAKIEVCTYLLFPSFAKSGQISVTMLKVVKEAPSSCSYLTPM
jgi:hypothetical protein